MGGPSIWSGGWTCKSAQMKRASGDYSHNPLQGTSQKSAIRPKDTGIYGRWHLMRHVRAYVPYHTVICRCSQMLANCHFYIYPIIQATWKCLLCAPKAVCKTMQAPQYSTVSCESPLSSCMVLRNCHFYSTHAHLMPDFAYFGTVFGPLDLWKLCDPRELQPQL